ncbi:hypothetical protein JHJ32_00060 [Parapedobacter sp. ISTM3]|uniref:hypothetical protein n=1 Tax=Parapedobacter sp. ISTM3 TaxID=2800130 RepID=UPI0019063550|nr:hypothetical protein [Parapedobacter sp. ISTM3]MBK1438364.1 hypothetical protein [Parapedobacter sp. ISTM3]
MGKNGKLERKLVIGTLSKIEATISVYDWKCGDIPLWPLIKKELFFIFLDQPHENGQSKPKKVESVLFWKFKTYVTSFWYVLAVKFRVKSSPKAVFCGAYSHRLPWKGKLINRYYYPFTRKLSTESYWEIEYGSQDKIQNYLNEERIIFLDRCRFAFRLIDKFTDKPKIELPDWDKMEKIVCEELLLDISSYKGKLESKAKDLSLHIRIFDYLFSKQKPEVIYSLCYYNIAMFALNHWCYINKIPIYDVQHGGQGPLHPMYSYSNYPKGGISILPKYFWCWDEGSYKNINNWLKDNLYHSAKLLGNPWLEFQIKNEKESLSSDKKIILYTLQERSLDPYIIETIMQTGGEYQWWLRLHPRMADAASVIRQQLSVAGAMKYGVKIETSNETPLPVLLKNAAVHISKFSGSIIEGIALKTPTVIMDPIGIDTYAHYIKNGDAFALPYPEASSLSDILRRILI